MTHNVPSGSRLEAEIRPHKGRPMVFINGEPHPLPGFNPKTRRGPFVKSLPFFCEHKMGVYIIQPSIARFWTGVPQDMEEDYFSLDEQAGLVLDGDPEAYLMVRFTPHPPKWWSDTHRQEYFITEEGTTPGLPSFSSDLFWETMAQASAAVIRYCESRPWASRW